MPKPHKIVNCDKAFDEFVNQALELYKKHRYVTFEWRIGEERSLDQNALFHIWVTLYAAHLLKIPKKEVAKGVIHGMKEKIKANYYLETGEAFMVHRIIDPWHPDKGKVTYTSSSDWKNGEMYSVLNWMQMKAAQDGLILEAKGKFKRNKSRETST